MTSLILYQQQPSTLSQLINQGPALSMYVSACHKLLISKYKNGAAICETAPLQITAGYLTLHREKLGLQLNTHMAVTTRNRHQPLRMPQIQATGCSKAPATYFTMAARNPITALRSSWHQSKNRPIFFVRSRSSLVLKPFSTNSISFLLFIYWCT